MNMKNMFFSFFSLNTFRILQGISQDKTLKRKKLKVYEKVNKELYNYYIYILMRCLFELLYIHRTKSDVDKTNMYINSCQFLARHDVMMSRKRLLYSYHNVIRKEVKTV